MQIIRGLNGTSNFFLNGTVLTIGDFDGVHLGHHQLLVTALARARTLNLLSVVLIFEPQPQEYFSKEEKPFRLITLKDKLKFFEAMGIDYVIVQKFNKKFSELTAEKFIEQVLIRKLYVKEIIIGYDFKFGYKRIGDFSLLAERSKKFGFIVKQIPAFVKNDQIASSTSIRRLLHSANFIEAEKLLGRRYSIAGEIKDINYSKLENFAIIDCSVEKCKFPLQQGVYSVLINMGNYFIDGAICIINKICVETVYLGVYPVDLQSNILEKKLEIQFKHQLNTLKSGIINSELSLQTIADIFSENIR